MLTPEDLGAISAAVAVVVRDAVAPLAERLGGVEESITGLETQFAEVRSEMQAHFRHLNDRLNRLEDRLATVELKLDHAISGRRADSARVDELEARIEALEAIVKNLPSH
jgi:chromosome segregation ATPase